MRIQELHCKNFRNIVDASIEFRHSFTVLIGVNGQGKSSWLHALRIAAGSYLLGIPQVKDRHIQDEEVRRESTQRQLITRVPVEVRALGTYKNEKIEWTRRKSGIGKRTTSSAADVGSIRDIARLHYQSIQNDNDNIDLPVIAYFGTSRVHGVGRSREMKSRIGREVFLEGYHSWEEMRSSKYRYPDWLASYDLLVKEGREYESLSTAFYECLKRAFPAIQEVQFVGSEIWVKAKFNDYQSDYLPISMHSDGIRSYIEMVAELAYRCVVLNAYKQEDAIKSAEGIVLIDELDIHLHPEWQKSVVSDLQSAFPKLQFIATTHSPFIVQSLRKEQLINLDRPDYSISDIDPHNRSLEEVAECEMNVDLPRRSELFQSLQKTAMRFFELISEGKSTDTDPETHKLKSELDRLEAEFSHDPVYSAWIKSVRKANGQ